MVCLLCESDQTYRRLAQSAAWEDYVRITTWEAAFTYAAEVTLFVLARRWIGRDDARRLRALRQVAPDLPMVVVTARDADNCRRLLGSGVNRALWEEDAVRAPSGSIRAVDGTVYLEHLARRVRGADHLDVRLRRALTHLLTEPPPVPAVTELARAAPCSTTTLWRLSRRSAASPNGHPTLESALRWTILVHSIALKRSGRPWTVVAERMGVHVDTLARTATKLTGSTLSSLASRGLPALVECYEATIIRPFLASGNGGRPPSPANASSSSGTRTVDHEITGVK